MEVSHAPVDIPTPRDVWTALNDLPSSQRVNSLLKKFESSHAGGFEDFERELHACSSKPSVRSPNRRSPATMWTWHSCSSTARCIAGLSLRTDLPHRRRCGVGDAHVVSSPARRAGGGGAGAQGRHCRGYWTPLAARQGAMLVSHLTPRDAEEVLATLGHMQPSKSSLDRLPKALSARWEAQRETFETSARGDGRSAGAARAVVVSLDGVMAADASGYREAGCATVSLVDGDGERLHSVRMGGCRSRTRRR